MSGEGGSGQALVSVRRTCERDVLLHGRHDVLLHGRRDVLLHGRHVCKPE